MITLSKIKKQVTILKSYKKTAAEEEKKSKSGEAKLEGISFRYKTVQFHLLDDTFQELKKEPETFGDLNIYSERFSLPGYGNKDGTLDGDEYQFEVIAYIESKTNSDAYFMALDTALAAIEKKHNVEILVTQYEEKNSQPAFNVHRITFYTKEEGVFSKE